MSAEPLLRISRDMNLIVPLTLDSGDTVYIHSTPIARNVFNSHFRVLAATYSKLWESGFGYQGAPRVAYLELQAQAKEFGVENIIEREVIAEIRRLTNIAVPSDKGYQQMTLDEAEGKTFGPEDMDEIMGLVCFFTLEVSMHRRPLAAKMMAIVGGMWGSQTTALGFTEYLSSLRTSTGAETSAAASGGSAESPATPEAASGPEPPIPVAMLR